jgi:hypothetical protein
MGEDLDVQAAAVRELVGLILRLDVAELRANPDSKRR